MAEEIERKYRLSREQFEALGERLLELEASSLGSFSEINLIFSSPGLERNSAVARIRTTERGSTLTFKRWLSSEGGLKRHIEHETRIGDPDETRQILEELGLSVRVVYEKKRRAWRFGNTEVVLDELPFGLYAEIEGTPSDIREAEEMLGAGGFEAEPETYPRLTERLGKKAGDLTEARF